MHFAGLLVTETVSNVELRSKEGKAGDPSLVRRKDPGRLGSDMKARAGRDLHQNVVQTQGCSRKEGRSREA